MIRASSSRSPGSTRRLARRLLGGVSGAALMLAIGASALANPDGGTVVSGSATITQTDPKTLTINQTTDKAIINWRNFSIGAGEHTKFVQPGANSAVLNRVTSGQVSQILGRLTANGKVFLINPNGVVFGNGAQVDVGSLITSTHDIRDQDFLSDTLRFTLAGQAAARIVNQGTISVREGGLVALVAPSIENSGVIYARLGRVALAAGDAVTIDPYGDDLITFEVPESVAEQLTDPEQNPLAALIDLSGDIIADGGGVLITADRARDAVEGAINMTGYIQAKSLETTGGKVVLDGGRGDITVAGTIDTSGIGKATGGEVRVVTDGALQTAAGSQILAEGGTEGGDGGFAAVSAWARMELAGRVSVKANTETAENGWLYQGANTEAARTIRNPNLDGAGRVGEGSGTVYFEANQGQTDEAVDFLTRGDNGTLFLSAADAVLAMNTASGEADVLTTALDGANEGLTATGEDKQQGTVNYLIGDDESQWVTDVETYKKVRYEDVYEGIDLVYYGNRAGDLEFDLQVAAGADASQIKLDYSGADSITKTAQGDLEIDTGTAKVVQKAPLVYQETAEARVLVPGDYQIGDDGKVSIRLDDYDRSKTLIVDPVVDTAAYIGGSGADAQSTRGVAIAIDSSGDSYITGRTASSDYAATVGDLTLGGATDAFVSKYDDSGSLVWATYFGGSGTEIPYDIAVDSSGRAYITGTASSADLSVTDASTLLGTQDAFLTRLSATGSSVEFNTYVGGAIGSPAVTFGNTVAVDGSGNFYAAGSTTATDFTTTSGVLDQTFGGAEDAWIVKYDNTDTRQWQTLLGGTTGGSGNEEIHGLDVDSSGVVYVTGRTETTDFPTAGSPNQASAGGGDDAFLSKISADGTTLLYSSYHGGSGDETGYDIDVDGPGNIVIVGETDSSDYPTLNAAQSSLSGSSDAFVVKFNNTGTPLYSTYLGGSGAEEAYRIAAGSSAEIVGVVGSTTSTDLTTTDDIQGSSGGGTDAFIAVLDQDGTALFQDYLGGSGTDQAYGVAIDGIDTMVVAGTTQSSNFPSASNSFLGGASDAFWMRIDISDLFAEASTGTDSDVAAAQSQHIGRHGDAPSAGGVTVGTIVDADALPQISDTEAVIGVATTNRVETARETFRSGGIEATTTLLASGEDYDFTHIRSALSQVEVTEILVTLETSNDAVAQQAEPQLAAVAEGVGPSLAEFSSWLESNSVSAEQSQTFVAMYLRMAEAFEETTFARALATAPAVTREIELADASPDGGIGALADVALDQTVSLAEAADGGAVISAALEEADDVAQVFVGDALVELDGEGRFDLAFENTTVINEDISITVVHQDGSVTVRPLFAEPDPRVPVYAGTAGLSRTADGAVTGRARLRDPANVRQVLVAGRPVPLAADGSLDLAALPPDAVTDGYVALVVARGDGTTELNRLAVTDEPPLLDAAVSAAADGELLGRAKAGDAERIAGVMVDGEPVEVAEDGSFTFRLAESAVSISRSIDITIVYENGAQAHQQLALDKPDAITGLDSFRTGGGLKIVEGRLAAPETVAELKVGELTVPVEADGSFVAPVPQAAENEDGFVPVNVVFNDGTVAAELVAPTPAPLLAEVDSRIAEDGQEVVDGRLAEPEVVAELRLGDEPVLFSADGRFQLSRSSTTVDESFALTIVYRDGSTQVQRLRSRRVAAPVTDLVPLRTKDGRQVTGRLADAENVAQIWVGGERLAVAEDGRFSLTLQETSFDVVESLAVTLIFTDGSRLDETLALRETPPVAQAAITPDAAGNPVVEGRLADLEDVAEVRIAGRPVPVDEEGAFSLALQSDSVDITRSLTITIVHLDGSVSERRVAAVGRPVLDDFRPALAEDGALEVVDGKVRAAGLLAEPEAVAGIEIAGQPVEIAADGSFLIDVEQTVVNINQSIDITIIYKDGTRAEEQVAMALPPVADDLTTVTAEDGTEQVLGRLEETEGVAGILVDGRLVPVDADGEFRFAKRETASTTQTTQTTETSVTVRESVNIVVIYADGRRAERRLAIDAAPLVRDAEVAPAADGTLSISAELAGLENVAEVLIDGTPVTVDESDTFQLSLQQTEINIDRSISITIVFEDGTRRTQQVRAETRALFEEVATRRTESGRPLFSAVLDRAQDIAEVLVDGRPVPVEADGRLEVALARTETSISQSVSVTIIYNDGSRADRRMALRDTPAVAESDLAAAPDGTVLATWTLADVESIAEVRIDGRPVPVAADGTLSLQLSETQINITDAVSLTIIYRDGSRVEQVSALDARSALQEFAALPVSEVGGIVEGRIDLADGVQSVLIGGEPVAVGADGSFRIDMAERTSVERQNLSLTLVYADGRRKVERLGVSATDLFTTFEASVDAAGNPLAEGRVAVPEQVAQVLVDGRAVTLSEEGSFSLQVAASRVDVTRDVRVTVVYRDGARVTRSMALRTDSVIAGLDISAGPDGAQVVSGRIADAARIAEVRFGGETVALDGEGRFRLSINATATSQTESLASRQMQIVYRDGTRQSKSIQLRTTRAFAGIDTYGAADGAGVIEGRLADIGNVAALYIGGARVRISADGGFVYRHSSLSISRSTRVSVRVVYKNGAVTGRQVQLNVAARRPVMLVRNVAVSADGFRTVEAQLGNGSAIAGLEIAGQMHRASADGRIVYSLPALAAGSETASQRVRVRVIYANGLDAETWVGAAEAVGGLIPLPRAPRKIALMVGNGRYGGGIGNVGTAVGDARLIGNVLNTRFGYETRVLANSSRTEMLAAMRRLGRELGVNDQLVVHYAGRGFTDRKTGQGYWLPTDARATSAANWVSTDGVYRMLRSMGLRRSLVLSDGGFSVSRASRTLAVVPPARNRAGRAQTPVSVITSGFGRPVQATNSDAHSAFTWRLASALSGISADTPAPELFRVIREQLAAPRPGQPLRTAAAQP
jgi:filamentous hemagglutinin family protein